MPLPAMPTSPMFFSACIDVWHTGRQAPHNALIKAWMFARLPACDHEAAGLQLPRVLANDTARQLMRPMPSEVQC